MTLDPTQQAQAVSSIRSLINLLPLGGRVEIAKDILKGLLGQLDELGPQARAELAKLLPSVPVADQIKPTAQDLASMSPEVRATPADTGSAAQSPLVPINPSLPLDPNLVQQVNVAAFSLLGNVFRADESGKNGLVSPPAILMGLSPGAIEGAERTQAAAKLLGCEFGEQALVTLGELSRRAKAVACAWVNSGLLPSERRQELFGMVTGAPTELDFSDRPNVAKTVNEWINTHCPESLRKKVLDADIPGSLSPNSTLLFLSALVFKGAWETPFTAFEDRAGFRIERMFGTFTLLDGVKKKVFADRLMGRLDTTELMLKAQSFEAVNLNLKDGAGRVLVVLPAPGKTFDEILTDQDCVALLSHKPQLQEGRFGISQISKESAAVGWTVPDLLHIIMPKLDIETDVDVRKALIRSGASGLFGFSDKRPTASGLPTAIDEMRQWNRLEMDEQGVRLESFTRSSEGTYGGEPEREFFICNRPHLVLIFSADNLLVGGALVRDPTVKG